MTPYWNIHTHLPSATPGGEILCCPPDAFSPQPRRWYSIGVHPREAGSMEAAIDHLRHYACHPRVLAVGEIGLDKLSPVPMPVQEEAFALQLMVAAEAGKPAIIHLVRAWDGLHRLRRRFPQSTLIIHGFRGKAPLAEDLLRHGFCLSFGPNFQAEALRATPLSRLFLETDTSTLPISDVYHRAASTLGIGEEHLCEAIDGNVRRLFFS